MGTPTPTNAILRTNLSTDDDNFFITRAASKSNYVYFDLDTNAVTGGRKIIMPDNDVTLGSATSVAASGVTTGDTDTGCSFVSAGTGNVTVGSGGTGNTVVGSSGTAGNTTLGTSSGTGTTTIRDPTGSILMSSGAISTSGITGITLSSGASGTTLDTTGTIDFQRNSTSQLALTDSTMTLEGSSAYIISHDSGADGHDLTISQTGTNNASLLLTSGGTGTDAIGLSCDKGGITIQSATDPTGASASLFGTNIEGTRMFKVNSTGITAPETYTFTPTASTANVFYVEVRVSVEDNATIGNSGAIVLKGSFTMTAAGTVTKLGDSTESFGSNLAATATFGISGSTFTVAFTPDGSVNTDFVGTISINTADDGLKLTGIA